MTVGGGNWSAKKTCPVTFCPPQTPRNHTYVYFHDIKPVIKNSYF